MKMGDGGSYDTFSSLKDEIELAADGPFSRQDGDSPVVLSEGEVAVRYSFANGLAVVHFNLLSAGVK